MRLMNISINYRVKLQRTGDDLKTSTSMDEVKERKVFVNWVAVGSTCN